MSARRGPAEALARAMRLRRAVPLALCSLALCLLLASDASSAAGLPPGGLPWALPLAWALTAAGVLSRLAAGLVAIGWVPKRVCSLLVDDLDPRRCLDAVEGCLPLLGLERKRLGPDGVSLAFSAGVSLALLGEDGGARAWLSWLSARADEPKQALWRAEARANAVGIASQVGDDSARSEQLAALRGVLDGPRPPKGGAARQLRAFLEGSERRRPWRRRATGTAWPPSATRSATSPRRASRGSTTSAARPWPSRPPDGPRRRSRRGATWPPTPARCPGPTRPGPRWRGAGRALWASGVPNAGSEAQGGASLRRGLAVAAREAGRGVGRRARRAFRRQRDSRAQCAL